MTWWVSQIWLEDYLGVCNKSGAVERSDSAWRLEGFDCSLAFTVGVSGSSGDELADANGYACFDLFDGLQCAAEAARWQLLEGLQVEKACEGGMLPSRFIYSFRKASDWDA